MGKEYTEITPELQHWISQQHLFFVATAPLGADGLINCSPKGMDAFRVLGPREVAYLDLTGSGIETVSHLRDNGRITIMFCAFEGPPRLVRLYGTGTVAPIGTPEFTTLSARFPSYPNARTVITVALERIADSCGYAVPRYEFAGDRDQLVDYAVKNMATALEPALLVVLGISVLFTALAVFLPLWNLMNAFRH
jgi:hypothetical protein